MVIDEMRAKLPPGTHIPKPTIGTDYRVKGWRIDNAGKYLMDYIFPSKSHPNKPNQKAITEREFIGCEEILRISGELRRSWYEEKFPVISNNRPCNFTTIGGVFIILGLAEYIPRGIYRKV